MKMNLLSLLAVMTASVAIPCNTGSILRGESARMDKSVALLFPTHPPRSSADGVALLFPTHPPRSSADGVAC
jgi:hypothetical protein